MSPTRLVLATFVVLGASGCAKHGVDTVKEMRARACAADPAGFLSHVDREEFARTTRATFEKRAEASIAKLDPADQAAAREKFDKSADAAAKTRVDDTFTTWEYDIKTHGPESEPCRLSILDSSETGDAADVRVTTPATGDRHWRMARSGGRWRLVSVGD